MGLWEFVIILGIMIINVLKLKQSITFQRIFNFRFWGIKIKGRFPVWPMMGFPVYSQFNPSISKKLNVPSQPTNWPWFLFILSSAADNSPSGMRAAHTLLSTNWTMINMRWRSTWLFTLIPKFKTLPFKIGFMRESVVHCEDYSAFPMIGSMWLFEYCS